METIKNYLDNMFVSLPKTTQMVELKRNILSNMEDKYNELKEEGKSENEAIGIVISEFGNIDELMNELGIRNDDVTDTRPIVTQEETVAYLAAKKTVGLQVGLGVFLCILAPASLILITQLIEKGYLGAGLSSSASGLPGLISLFLLVAIAVSLFIYSGMNFERFKYMEEGIQLPTSVKTNLKQQYDSFTPAFTLSLILGVCLLITSPIVLFIFSLMNTDATSFGVVALLGIVAIAVFLFIYFGSIRESYSRLLRIGDYSEKKEKESKVIGAVASIVWPLAVAIFLFSGFVNNQWHIAWIVFPITGILFGMFSAAFSIITGKNN